MEVITQEQREHRISEIVSDHISKTRRKGDYHFLQAISWGAEPDWMPADDEFMPDMTQGVENYKPDDRYLSGTIF